MVKAFDLMTYTDPRRRLFGKMLKLSLFDRDITAIFNEDDIVPLPDQLAQQTPAEDHYLVQLYIASDADLLITSDVKLHDALDSVGSINVQLRDDFLQKYLSR
jgi:predicted nucleic acid-binding protein